MTRARRLRLLSHLAGYLIVSNIRLRGVVANIGYLWRQADLSDLSHLSP